MTDLEICLKKDGKYCGKRRKCWFSAFSPFPTMFSKGSLFWGVKSRDCVVKIKVSTHWIVN